MPVLRAEDAPRYQLPGVTITGLAAASRGAAELTTYRVTLDPGSALPPHRHDHEEVFTVFVGSVTTVLDGEEHVTGPGDTVIVPAGTEHYVYSGDHPADLIAAVPAGTVFITADGGERVADWGK
jgi:quercetin dioxygenase-like cupin family protein